MILGLLPATRGGLGELARTGQHVRLIDGYLRPYAEAFEEVRYFSYLRESLEDHVRDPALSARVRVLPGGGLHPWLYALALPLWWRRELAACAVLRVFQVTGALPAVIARRWLGVPFVTTYGFWYTRLARTRTTALLRAAVERLGLRAAAAVIVTTPELAAHVRGRVGPETIVQLVPNGVDPGRFHPVPRAREPEPRVVYVGRLSPEKNLGVLVEAAGRLRARRALRLVLVGQGPERAALEAAARASGVPVDFVPVVPHDRLPAQLGGAAAFVLPSLTEGHPKALLEAMACALPCVASDVGGNRAILRDGETGLLFDPRDAGALAERLEAVLADDALAARLGAAARAEVLARYDLGRLVAEEIALLRRVGGGRPAALAAERA
jgi:glycosyltransferase involved in cell wall biosynthesis